MAKGRKRKDSADENVEACRHETETRKNVVPVRLRRFNNEVQHLGEQKRRCYPKCLCQRTTNILPWTKENS